jgi:hypothetical protein
MPNMTKVSDSAVTIPWSPFWLKKSRFLQNKKNLRGFENEWKTNKNATLSLKWRLR